MNQISNRLLAPGKESNLILAEANIGWDREFGVFDLKNFPVFKQTL
jgi:hypothetical protein